MSARNIQRTRFVYGGLVLLWGLVIGWQAWEHQRVRQRARAELIHRARDISNTLGVVIRSQRRFGWLVFKEGLESAFKSLLSPGQLEAIALLNADEEVVASAGARIDFDLKRLAPRAEFWGRETVALMNLVDLGTNVTTEPDSRRATIVLPSFGTNRPAGTPPQRWRDEGDRDRERERDERDGGRDRDRDRNLDERPADDGAAAVRPEARGDAGGTASTNVQSSASAVAGDGRRGAGGTRVGSEDANEGDPIPRRSRRGGRGDGRFPFGRPWWMSEAEYQELVEKQGVHSFVLVLSTRSLKEVTRQDLWARGLVSAFATMSALGLALAWRNLVRSSDLEVRLARAAELNARLKEMNLAAAGLAHETRNPLNIIRGLAQMISRQTNAPPDVHSRSRDIIAETDRVTAQLNEFINYSRPRDVRWSAVPLGAITQDVARALSSDLEDRTIELRVEGELPVVQGDEPLIRQALFNLLLNAIQAADRGGRIVVSCERSGPGEFRLQIADDGHGVRPEHRSEIFKPYFTTHAEGTGLGLAIVQQIVLAHGWEIDCVPNEPKGTIFRIHHLKTASRSQQVS